MGRGAGNDRPLHGITVFIAEDELLIGLDLEAIVGDVGAAVLGPYPILKLAVQAASEETFSVAILDVRLGRETTQQVVEILARRAIPFVFYTGQEVPEEIRSICAPSAVLAKPADQKLLVDTIVRILRTPVQKARSEKGFAKAAPEPGTHGATRDPG